MTELHRCLAANLKALRSRWGLSQAELAEQSEVSVSYVGEIEMGVKWPQAAILERLSKALHVKPYLFFLDPADTLAHLAWLERRDQIVELGEDLIAYFEKRRR
jgi:transcriptional regulator with XRE-family HTH domain